MENTYLTAFHGMEQIMPEFERPLESFKKKTYADFFRKYYEEHVQIYAAVEKGYLSAVDKEQYILNMAGVAVSGPIQQVQKIAKKNKREAKLMDANLCMVVYVLPGILKYAGESAKPLTEEILRLWKAQFPTTNLSAAPFEEIEAGFHKKFCYITTAVCECFGKADDCYELTILRNYRDGYLMSQPEGEEIIREYYDVAPTIVKRINRCEQKKQIYRMIWETYLQPCIHMIEDGENEECKELYIRMVKELQEEYFYQKAS